MATSKFIGNKKVEVQVNGFTVRGDVPASLGGDNEYPAPLDLLQAALLVCSSMHAGIFVDKLGMDRKLFRLELEPVFKDNGDIAEVSILIYVPKVFPADKEKNLLSIVQGCIVGRHVTFPRNISIVRP